MPGGTTVSFSPQTIPAPGAGSSTMTITVGVSTPTGIYPITVTGNGGGVQQNTTVTLTVVAPPSFTISASPSSLSVAQGNQGTSTITTTISGGFNSSITLSASGVAIRHHGELQSEHDSGARRRQLDHDHHGGQQHAYGNLSHHRDRQWRRHSAEHHRHPDRGRRTELHDHGLAVLHSVFAQGNQGTSTITTTISGGFNSSISLSASGVPTGTTVSFNPTTIRSARRGQLDHDHHGRQQLAPTGTYPITVTGNGGGIQQNTTVTLTVIGPGTANFTISAITRSASVSRKATREPPPSTTTISSGFNSSISLVGFRHALRNHGELSTRTRFQRPGAGNSTMTITVGGNTPTGTYPITVTGNGGGSSAEHHGHPDGDCAGRQFHDFWLSPARSPADLKAIKETLYISTTVSGGFNSSIACRLPAYLRERR